MPKEAAQFWEALKLKRALVRHPFHAKGFFLYPLKISKNRDFLMFTRVIERDQWHEMGKVDASRLTTSFQRL